MSNEQSIRDELTLIARDVHLYDGGTNQALAGLDAQRIADAILASPVIRRIQAEAWAEGAEYAWGKTGEGWNGEYAGGHGTHDGTVSFIDANGDHNPHIERGETA